MSRLCTPSKAAIRTVRGGMALSSPPLAMTAMTFFPPFLPSARPHRRPGAGRPDPVALAARSRDCEGDRHDPVRDPDLRERECLPEPGARGMADGHGGAHPLRRAGRRERREDPRRRGAAAHSHRHVGPRRRRHRRAVCRDEGGTRRFLPDRGQGSRPCPGDRQALPGALRRSRGPPDPGHLRRVTLVAGSGGAEARAGVGAGAGARAGAGTGAGAMPSADAGARPGADASAAVADAHRREWAFVLAATARVTRDIDLAEECVQDAYVAALDAWSRQGIPRNPGAWLTTTARRRALDALRRDRTLRAKLPLLIEPDPPLAGAGAASPGSGGRPEENVIPDDRL